MKRRPAHLFTAILMTGLVVYFLPMARDTGEAVYWIPTAFATVGAGWEWACWLRTRNRPSL